MDETMKRPLPQDQGDGGARPAELERAVMHGLIRGLADFERMTADDVHRLAAQMHRR